MKINLKDSNVNQSSQNAIQESNSIITFEMEEPTNFELNQKIISSSNGLNNQQTTLNKHFKSLGRIVNKSLKMNRKTGSYDIVQIDIDNK